MNARRKQVYTALFRFENGVATRLLPDDAIAISDLGEILAKYDEPIYLVGDGYQITKELLTAPTCDTPERLIRQSAYSVAQVALRAYQNGAKTTDAEMVPTYLRLSQAERERNERLKQENTPKI
jgi:tRNA A37 threonylcarbamoyladenosine modification protein TsaB